MKSLGDVGAGHVLGRYELLMPIASGGMATVWAARLKGTRGFQKIVAIKTMLPNMTDDAEFEQMFLDEATLASRIRHPHVVEILDLGEENGVLYLVMEWVDGEPLSVLLKAAAKKGGIPLPVGVRITTHACSGLHAAHELRDEGGKLVGLVHRDVSPQNVLVTFDGVVKVVDFGVAKATGRLSAETNAGQIKGKAAYMSPEQARGAQIDRRTDVFAMGILLYQLTTGKHPFRGENDVATLYNITSDTPVFPPRKVVPGYPPALEVIVTQALAKDPNKRYPTASDLARALDQALPKSIRVSTDEEVGAFISDLLSERREKRQEALKSSLRLADDRAAGRVQMQRIASDAEIIHSSTGFTPVSNVSGVKVPTSVSGVTTPDLASDPDGEPTSTANRKAGALGTGSSLTPPPGAADIMDLTVDYDDAGNSRRNRRMFAVGAVVVGVAAAVAIVASRSGKEGQAAPAATQLDTVKTATAGEPDAGGTEGITEDNANGALPVQHVEASSDAGSVGAHVATEASGRAEPRMSPVVVAHNHVHATPVPTPAPTPTTAPPPKSTSTTFVPPIRNPGF